MASRTNCAATRTLRETGSRPQEIQEDVPGGVHVTDKNQPLAGAQVRPEGEGLRRVGNAAASSAPQRHSAWVDEDP